MASTTFFAPFQFNNSQLLAFYQKIAEDCDEGRKRAIAERHNALKKIADDSSGHENACFHCYGHPISHTNYKELDWTVRLFYSLKNQFGTDFNVKPSYEYASNYKFPTFQQQISSCSSSGVYPLRGAPDLLFTHKRFYAGVR